MSFIISDFVEQPLQKEMYIKSNETCICMQNYKKKSTTAQKKNVTYHRLFHFLVKNYKEVKSFAILRAKPNKGNL